jgi:hypothetical protein
VRGCEGELRGEGSLEEKVVTGESTRGGLLASWGAVGEEIQLFTVQVTAVFVAREVQVSRDNGYSRKPRSARGRGALHDVSPGSGWDLLLADGVASVVVMRSAGSGRFALDG